MNMIQRTAASGTILVVVLASWVTSSAADEVDATAYMPQWSGLYLGVQAGGGRGSSFQDILRASAADAPIDIDGGFIGGSVEYLWQSGQFVFGPQAEISWTSIDGTFDLSASNHFFSDADWFGSIGGKAGFAIDNLLVFGTAGFALADISEAQNNSIIQRTYSDSQLNTGYSLGAGLDLALQDGWVLGAEYRYYNVGGLYFADVHGADDRSVDTQLQTISVRLRKKLY